MLVPYSPSVHAAERRLLLHPEELVSDSSVLQAAGYFAHEAKVMRRGIARRTAMRTGRRTTWQHLRIALVLRLGVETSSSR